LNVVGRGAKVSLSLSGALLGLLGLTVRGSVICGVAAPGAGATVIFCTGAVGCGAGAEFKALGGGRLVGIGEGCAGVERENQEKNEWLLTGSG
jgi:hypothetical protein